MLQILREKRESKSKFKEKKIRKELKEIILDYKKLMEEIL
jgi:hypothetical protein